MDINKDLLERIDRLDENLSYLAKELLYQIDKNKTVKSIEESILDEINEIVAEEGN